jgi:hypothetical protein
MPDASQPLRDAVCHHLVEQVADRAGADLGFVRRLIALGAIGPSASGYAERDVQAVEAGELSWSCRRRHPPPPVGAGQTLERGDPGP